MSQCWPRAMSTWVYWVKNMSFSIAKLQMSTLEGTMSTYLTRLRRKQLRWIAVLVCVWLIAISKTVSLENFKESILTSLVHVWRTKKIGDLCISPSQSWENKSAPKEPWLNPLTPCKTITWIQETNRSKTTQIPSKSSDKERNLHKPDSHPKKRLQVLMTILLHLITTIRQPTHKLWSTLSNKSMTRLPLKLKCSLLRTGEKFCRN